LCVVQIAKHPFRSYFCSHGYTGNHGMPLGCRSALVFSDVFFLSNDSSMLGEHNTTFGVDFSYDSPVEAPIHLWTSRHRVRTATATAAGTAVAVMTSQPTGGTGQRLYRPPPCAQSGSSRHCVSRLLDIFPDIHNCTFIDFMCWHLK